jgi:hypothetical protein
MCYIEYLISKNITDPELIKLLAANYLQNIGITELDLSGMPDCYWVNWKQLHSEQFIIENSKWLQDLQKTTLQPSTFYLKKLFGLLVHPEIKRDHKTLAAHFVLQNSPQNGKDITTNEMILQLVSFPVIGK